MLLLSRILVSTLVLGASAVVLSGCGQKGDLYLPTEPASANRATLPQIIVRSVTPGTAERSAPASPARAASSPATP